TKFQYTATCLGCWFDIPFTRIENALGAGTEVGERSAPKLALITLPSTASNGYAQSPIVSTRLMSALELPIVPSSFQSIAPSAGSVQGMPGLPNTAIP